MSDESSTRKGLLGAVSRRNFLRGAASATAAVSAIELSPGEAAAKATSGREWGPDAATHRLEVNGESVEVAFEPRESLAEVLAHRLGRTGTKIGCDRGSCGACTVHIDGRPRASCLTPAVDAVGKAITTVEGLSTPDGPLHPVQQAFIEADAMQCGYCIPGFVMSAAALLARTSEPTTDEIRTALAGNICRCGSQPHIEKAVVAAGKRMRRT